MYDQGILVLSGSSENTQFGHQENIDLRALRLERMISEGQTKYDTF